MGRLEDADRFFPEQALHQGVDVGRQHLFLLQGRRQHHGAVPGFQRVFLGQRHRLGLAAVVRQFLQQQAARGAVVGGQPQLGVELFRAQHIIFNHGCHVVAVKRHDALVRLLARHLVGWIEGDDEAALAVRVQQRRHRRVRLNDGLRIELGGGAQAQFGIALDHQQAHRTVAMDLHDDRTVEFQVGRQQRGGRHHFAQHFFDGRGVVVVRQHFAPRGRDVDEFAAHRRVIENKFLQRVFAHVRRHAACRRVCRHLSYPICLSCVLNNWPRCT